MRTRAFGTTPEQMHSRRPIPSLVAAHQRAPIASCEASGCLQVGQRSTATSSMSTRAGDAVFMSVRKARQSGRMVIARDRRSGVSGGIPRGSTLRPDRLEPPTVWLGPSVRDPSVPLRQHQPSSVSSRSISASAAANDAAPCAAYGARAATRSARVSSASTGYNVICIDLANSWFSAASS